MGSQDGAEPRSGMAARPGATESVPVAERLRVMQYLRLAAILLVLLGAGAAPDVLAPGVRPVVVTTLLYAAAVASAELAGRLPRVGPWLVFRVLLAVDVLYLGWASYLTGGLTSPLRYGVLLHLGAVVLLASYRTGLLLAVGHSLLLVAVFVAQQTGALHPTGPPTGTPGLGGTAAQRLAVFVVVLWLVALLTSALSAFNERELRRRRYDLEALTALAEQLERTGDSAGVARTLLDSAVTTFRFSRGVVVAGAEGQLCLLAAAGLEATTARRPGRPGSSPLVVAAHRTHAAVLADGLDPATEPWLCRLLPGARHLVVVPMAAEGRPLGALVLEQGPGRSRLQRRVLAALERSASYASLALRNAWLLEQVQRLAATDGLTKIANRRTFESTLEREVARAARNAEHVSLVMLDIDHFKRLNDEQGHQAGDELLRNVAASLSCECRDFDTPARYGGEEFAVVLPGCGPDEAHLIGERLRQAVAAAPGPVSVTASAGVATYPTHAEDADTLVRAADVALYLSKRAGRDRTSVSTGVPAEAGTQALLRSAVVERLGRRVLETEPSDEGLSD